ncbi:MAG TPA: right-handed parallel beta-helix repeat-containing protein [Caldilineaceae bacterium]|nr:right-handed parallel beta-helix repeat-containing protein [Caldilineaceae bacterium]
MINIIDYGAIGDGVFDNKSAIESAIEAAKSKQGETVLFPQGVYFLEQPVYKTGLYNLRFTGEGAMILCTGNTDVPDLIGRGGGLLLEGNQITIENLTFQGHLIDPPSQNYSADYQYGRLLQLGGNDNQVTACFFKGGNGGAVLLVNGRGCSISHNVMQACNNHSGGGDYGAIHLYGACSDINVSNNRIYDHCYSGISAIGGGEDERPTNILIQNNFIRSASASREADHSMGIYLLNGANQYISITGNVVEQADAEGIIVASYGTRRAKGIVIANNVIRDCAYRGISLQSFSGGTFDDVQILGNLVEDGSNVHSVQQIYCDELNESIISGNRCVGYTGPNTGLDRRGIELGNSPKGNLIVNNVVTSHNRGIVFYSHNSILMGNRVNNCVIGILLGYCGGSNVIGNILEACETPIEKGTGSSPIIEVGNQSAR